MSTLEHRRGERATLAAAVLVVVAAGAATAHGLYEVARGSGTPPGVAWLYPVITDGLALVAYAATTRTTGAARRYAWSVVVLAAGLSGLAQAVYLAGAVAQAPTGLRFGVGAWPAVAAAIAAHLLFLIGHSRRAGGALPVVEVEPPAVDPAPEVVDSDPPAVDRSPTSDDEILADLRTWIAERGTVPSRDEVRLRYSIGSTRAARLLVIVDPGDGESLEVTR